jgi:hypothetical protein
MPVIIGATGTLRKSFRRYLSNIAAKHAIKELQKAAILCTAHIFRKVLTQKYRTSNIGNNTTCSINSKYRTDAALYNSGTSFVSGIYEGVATIFRNGAANYAAVVVARSTGIW